MASPQYGPSSTPPTSSRSPLLSSSVNTKSSSSPDSHGDSPVEKTTSIGNSKDANFPVDGEGRVYHLGLKYGELANRVVLVGDPNRAKLISSFFDDVDNLFVRSSNRGFTTYTGRFNGTPVSVMAIGMGLAMMDFAVREARYCCKGPLAFVRLGTCGTPHPDITIGSVVVSNKSLVVSTNFDAFGEEQSTASSAPFYNISKFVEATPELNDLLVKCMEKNVTERKVISGPDATADSFYSSQGRLDASFADHNHTLIDEIMKVDEGIASLQMETFMLFHLARLSDSIHAAGSAIVLAQRKVNAFLDNDSKHQLEKVCGKACLECLVEWKKDHEFVAATDPECVWNH
eukprot:TRINITY_DN466_c0_g1_i2.p1 TRINITY_DN466_c0_g1~~TRINITY_DN466_c0_g1_i2.p1  ORF type:complete len:376 (+),score=85.30 TRINITY_DN466_c0_g1_i2:96-1130(+)